MAENLPGERTVGDDHGMAGSLSRGQRRFASSTNGSVPDFLSRDPVFGTTAGALEDEVFLFHFKHLLIDKNKYGSFSDKGLWLCARQVNLKVSIGR